MCKWIRVNFSNILSFLVGLIGMFFIFDAVYLVHQDKLQGAIELFSAGFLLLIFTQLHKFDLVEAFGFKAKMREIDRKLEIVNVFLPISEMMISAMMRIGRTGSAIPRRKRFEIMEELETSLKAVDFSDNQLEEIKKDWHKINLVDLKNPINNFLIDKFLYQKRNDLEHGSNTTPAQRDKLSSYTTEVKTIIEMTNKNLWLFHEYFVQSVNSSTVLTDDDKKKILNNPEVQESLADLKYYGEHKMLRRKEHFFAKDDKLL